MDNQNQVTTTPTAAPAFGHWSHIQNRANPNAKGNF